MKRMQVLEDSGTHYPHRDTPIRSLAYVNYAERPKLISGGEDARVLIWDANSEHVRKSLVLDSHVSKPDDTMTLYQSRKISHVIPHPCGSRIAVAVGRDIFMIGTVSQCLLRKVGSHTAGAIESLAWSSSDRTVRHLLSTDDDCSVVTKWDMLGKRLNTVDVNLGEQRGRRYVQTVLPSPNGMQALEISNSFDDAVHQCVKLRGPGHEVIRLRDIYTSQVMASGHACWSPDGESVFFGGVDGNITRWTLDNPGDGFIGRYHDYHITAMTASPSQCYRDYLYASADEEGVIAVWTPDRLGVIREYEGHIGAVFALAFSTNNEYLWSGGQDGTIRRWSLDLSRLRMGGKTDTATDEIKPVNNERHLEF